MNSPDNPSILYAWFSTRQSHLTGIKRWRTPNGNIVASTFTTQHREHCLKFDDVVFVGEVLKDGFVDYLAKGELDGLDHLPISEFIPKMEEVFAREERRCKSSRNREN